MNAIIFLLLTATGASARGPEFAPLARELAAAARSAGIDRVAVTGFESAGGREDGVGLGLSERLTIALARTGRVQAVERRLLPRLMQELALARSGALDETRRLGRVMPVDGIVTGTWLPSRRGIRVLARLVQVETGLIVGAAELELEPEPAEVWTVGNPFSVSVPVLDAPFPDMGMDGALSPQNPLDSPRLSCDGAAARVDRLEESILDLKARYWAQRLKQGLAGNSLKTNPGSTITDPLLKRRFYDRMKEWHASETIPPLTPVEVRRFVQVDGDALSLHRECAL